MVGDDDLALLEELVGHADAFAEQSAGILPQVENQSLHVAHLVQRLLHFVLGGLLEAGDVHVADAGTNQEMQIDASSGESRREPR